MSFALRAYADDATSSPDVSETTAASSSVQTGDASSLVGASNSVNTNDTSVDNPTASTTVSNANDATVIAAASSTADTGVNTVVGSTSGATIVSGNSLATANVINVINTNITNSNGLLEFLNMFLSAGIDLRSMGLSDVFGSGAASSSCSFVSCQTGSLAVSNSNTATLSNEVLVRSSTGGNTASSTGSSTIQTGDAAASANVLNVVNANITNSNYLLVSLNNFGSLAGDITLPNADFFKRLEQFNSNNGSLSVSNTNSATVSNTTSAVADSGNNNASSTDGSASVATGNSLSGATTVNQVNTNSVGGSNVFILVHVLGNWAGSVHGLPPGYAWVPTSNGVAITSQSGDFSALTGSTTPEAQGSLAVSNTNTANVSNNVQVYALTGENVASGSDSSISTGNAYASANVVNLVNTNIIGQNWIFAILNVFGDWLGNLTFGRPDLWVGGVVEAKSPTGTGGTITYHFTVANHGDLDATDVVLKADFDKKLIVFNDQTASTSSGMLWDLGAIAKGESKDFTYTATAGPVGDLVEAPLTATVSSSDTDNNDADNTEHLTLVLGTPPPFERWGPGKGIPTTDPKLSLVTTQSATSTEASTTVDYTIVVGNDGGAAYAAVLTDKLLDPSGGTVFTRSWNLDTIQTGDEIDLSYSVNYDSTTVPGLYTNSISIVGQKGNPVPVYAVDMTPVYATSTLSITAQKQPGIVLGASTEIPSCGAFLTTYLKPGGKNNSSSTVALLQYYLQTFEHINIKQTGVYDAQTVAAVKKFQLKYASDILTPWNLKAPTGLVYYTTQQKINNIYCQGRQVFNLTPSQQTFINLGISKK